MTLKKQHKMALCRVKDGGDVFDPMIARLLREVEAEQPDYVNIVEPAGDYSIDAKRPYFGAMATVVGREWAEQ